MYPFLWKIKCHTKNPAFNILMAIKTVPYQAFINSSKETSWKLHSDSSEFRTLQHTCCCRNPPQESRKEQQQALLSIVEEMGAKQGWTQLWSAAGGQQRGGPQLLLLAVLINLSELIRVCSAGVCVSPISTLALHLLTLSVTVARVIFLILQSFYLIFK